MKVRKGKKFSWLMLVMLIGIFGMAQGASAQSAAIFNGYQFTDTDGNGVHAHGGNIIKHNGYYYFFGENRNEDNTFYAVSVYRSTDLKNWEFRNHVLTQSSHPELALANIERPKVVYNASTGKFVMWMHKENGIDYSEAKAAVAYSDTIDGDYTYTGSFRPMGIGSRDCTLFVDDNGDAYFIASSNGNADLNFYKLSSDYLTVDSLAKSMAGAHREAPAVFKRNGVYFLLTSGNSGWWPNQQKYATSTTGITGTYSNFVNVGDGNAYRSQTTFVLPIQNSSGNTTSFMYMGDRWAGAWNKPVIQSRYVWANIEFPTNTSMTFNYNDVLNIDVDAGTITGENWTTSTFDPNTAYSITNKNSGKALSVQGPDRLKAGAKIEQATVSSDTYQKWNLIPVPNSGANYYYIVNVNSGKYIDVPGNNDANGLAMTQYYGNNGNNQQWKMIDLGNNEYKLMNRQTEKFLEIQGNSTANGALVVQNQPDITAGQTWIIPESPNSAANVSADKAALAIGYTGTDSSGGVTKKVTLPGQGANGSSITWAASNPSVIDVNGNVTRPVNPSPNATATLTATITNGSVSDTKTFTLTVLAANSIFLQAENALLGPGVTVNSTGSAFNGTGFADFSGGEGYLEWTVNVAQTDTYTLNFRYANGAGDRPMTLAVDGTTVAANLSFPGTSSWNAAWSNSTQAVSLTAGTHTIRLTTKGSSGPNIDQLQLIY
ncbi:RICIN domain-containing protein [Paenibacillus pasadenensis]|uniref:RICIN domain-containing protein n=1 Tax=Paenibacillus pasadenensis TaxID=217090 RepID=UPI00203F4106|nr:RICIN domain-containing protein [Paenibacillus pasadenensis]MCM3749607.1 RICIN domain-containing protein [Paenibacillus pasadenensis]